uniref:Tudor domain-containing protein Tdr4 n=1 Tax=Locusta migratoria TaxID=7004 RepID=A0AAU7J8D4_LOCMI
MSTVRIKRTFTCFNCNLPFSVKDIRALRGPRCPLILKCGHSICEACAQISLKESSEIICGLCYHGTPCFSDNVRADLPFNSYVLGVAAEKHTVSVTEDSSIAFQLNRRKATTKVYSETKEKCVECNRFADASCYQCDALYCSGCFSKVHRTVKALQKHKKYPLSQTDPKGVLPFPMCKEHPEQKLEFSCADCEKIVCSHCIILYHQRHEVCTVKKKNEEYLEKLKEARSKAEYVLKRLENTKLKLEKIYSVPSVHHAQQLELQISRHFLYLHGLLQLMEETLLTQVQELKQGVSFSLQNVTRQVEDNIENISKLLKEAHISQTPENITKVDMNCLIQKLEETDNMPCHLISNVGEYVSDESAEFIVDTAFMEQIENHCKIELPPMECYTLVSTQELPEDAVIDSLEDTESLTDTGSQLSLFSSVSQEGTLGRDSVPLDPLLAHSPDRESAQIEPLLARIVPEEQSGMVTHVRNDIGKGSQETVTVCYIKNPHCFFVHRERDKATFKTMNHSLVKHILTRPDQPSEVVEGEIYAVKYSEDKRWYRARAVSLKYGAKEPAAEVHYIDFGNTETVPFSRLRSLPDDIKSVPVLCAQCSLFGIAPVGGSWTAEANERFTEMIEGCQVVMVIMGYSSNIYEVDLCEVSGVVNSKVPFSVRDALVFLQFACFLDSSVPTLRTAANPMSSYLVQDIKAGELLQVRVSHINSPTSFYVQRTGAHARSLYSLRTEMKKYYNNPPDHKIYKPEIGMPCAALNGSKNWCRGQVIGLPGNKKVKVFFVDTGSELDLPWYEVFRLPEKFLAVPKQAIHCALNDISPTLKSGWPAEIKKVMLDLTFKKSLKLFVDSVCDTNLFVTLYDVQHEMDICINAVLVREGYALSTGMSSVLVEYAKSGVSVQDTVPHKKAETRVISKAKPQAVDPTKTKTRKAVSEVTPDPEIKENSDPFRLRVTVLALESPSCFYVKLKAVESVLSDLMKELQEYYNTSIGIETAWEEGEKCVVFNAADKLWCRGIITDITDDEASVFLTDFATYLKVPTNCIQTLDPRFSEVHSGAIACHLVGVKAAGDRSQWPSLACEHLAELIHNYTELYITKRGEIENNSLPVELWVKDVFEGGPLDPTTEVWNTLNQKLIDQGLAIPVKVDNEELVCPSSDVLKELNSINKENHVATFPKKDVLKRTVKLNQTCDIQEDNDEEEQYIEDVGSSVDNCKTEMSFTKNSAEVDDREQLLFEKYSNTKKKSGKLELADSMTDWLPPVPLKKSHFSAIATNVDSDAIIYLHDREESDTLTMIQNALQSRFTNSKPAPHDLFWFPGQVCIAKYHGDKKWYRGKVLQLNEDSTLKIQFVDYGNVEDCRATELRKDVLFQEIPVQCHKCKLAGIEPKSGGSVWDTTGLDLLHVSVVDQTTSVTVKKFPKKIGDPYVISLVGPRNLNIADFMVQRNFARYTFVDTYESDKECDTSADISAGVIIVDVSEEFKDMSKDSVASTATDTPDGDDDKQECSEKEITVTSVEVKEVLCEEKQPVFEELALNISDKNIQSEIQKLSCSKENTEMEDEEEEEDEMKGSELTETCHNMTYIPLKVPDCNQMIVDVIAMLSATEYIIAPLKWGESQDVHSREDYVKIDDEIQLYGPFQPVLEKPTLGMPCCAEYNDGRWYRAIIVSVNDNEVQIQYVDYGNIESVTKDRVHEMRLDWLQVPIQVLRCQLWNLEVSETADMSTVLDSISQCMLQQNLRALIKERQPTLIVELETINDGKLAYQKLLDTGILKRTDSNS